MNDRDRAPKPASMKVHGKEEVEAIERELARLREHLEAEEVPEKLSELGRRLQWLADQKSKGRR